jgi:hypothetical protein
MPSNGICLISGLAAFVASAAGSPLCNTTSAHITESATLSTALSAVAAPTAACGSNVACILAHFTERPVLVAASTLAGLTSTVTVHPSNYTEIPDPAANATGGATGSVTVPLPTASIAPTGGPVNSTIHVPMDSKFTSFLCPPASLTVHPGLHCGIFNTANTRDAEKVLGGFGHERCITEAHTCTRHGCLNTSGVYGEFSPFPVRPTPILTFFPPVCNDNAYAIDLQCSDIAAFGYIITGSCCAQSTSGQYFSDPAGFNVIVAYGNCNHGKSADRPSMGPPSDPWGPNGACAYAGAP